MKKIGIFFVLFLTLFFFAACKEDNTIDASLEIQNITLTKGQNTEIDYKINPAGTFGVVSFEIISGNDKISIIGTTLSALEAGEAEVKATASNMKGAVKTFVCDTTFSVIVNPITAVAGEHILNGGFELGLLEWNLLSNPITNVYGTTVVDNNPHSGDAALNLWFDANADEVGEALDLILSQDFEGLENGEYLFSLWFTGAITSIEMSILDGTTVLESESFSGFDYKSVPDHNNYVQYGLVVELNNISSVSVQIKVLGEAECWGYLDDVSFKKGSLEDLLKAPVADESEYLNFINDGAFNSLSSWKIETSGEAASKEAKLANGKLSIWASGNASFKISQTLNLPESLYNLVIYFNGGEAGSEFNAEDAYAYVKVGETLHKLMIVPTGWGDGEMARIILEDLALDGNVEVGLYFDFTSGTNNWINVDDFVLYSEDLEIEAADLEAANQVVALITALDLEALSVGDEAEVIAARTAYDALSDLQKTIAASEEALLALEAKLKELKNPSPDGYYNFIIGGGFDDHSDYVISVEGEAASKTANFNGKLEIWANGEATYLIKQTLSDLEADVYQLLIEFNGGSVGSEFNASEAYVYLKQGEVIKQANILPLGWNEGKYSKLYILDFTVEQDLDVEVGIKIVFESGTNNWINFDNLILWSKNIETAPTADLAAAALVDAQIAELSLETLTLEDEDEVIAARTAYDELTKRQKSLVSQLELLKNLEAKILDLKNIVTYPLVTMEEFNLQGGFEDASYSMETLKWATEGAAAWTSDNWAYEGTYKLDFFKEQSMTTGKIYKGIKDLNAGTYELTLYLAAGSLDLVQITLGDEVQELEGFTGSYGVYKFYVNYDGEEHLYLEVAITRADGGWASLDSLSLSKIDYPLSSLEDFNLHGGFEPVDEDWSLTALGWQVNGGNAWTDGDWPQSGSASYALFKESDALTANITKGVIINEVGTYKFSLYLAGGDLTKVEVHFGSEVQVLSITAAYAEQLIEFEVLNAGIYQVVINVERAASGWIQLDNISLNLETEA